MSEITTSTPETTRPRSIFDFVGPSHCYSDPTERIAEMARLREQLKEKKVTNVKLAYRSRVSAGWVGQVLLGRFPHDGAFCMPKNIATAIEGYNITLPPCFRWPKAHEELPTESQISYIQKLCVKAGQDFQAPQNKAEASKMILELNELLNARKDSGFY